MKAADLPLHGGHVPRWMLNLMRGLAEKIVEAIVLEYGPAAVLQGLNDPVWFQAFNNVIGMDWDSSGSTTVLTGILKDVTWRNPELGFLVVGGKGAKSLKVPDEIRAVAEAYNLSISKEEELVNASRLAAKADTAFLQDGYPLYHHTVIIDEKGNWIIVQQGMNPEERMARRYHIDRTSLTTIHSGIAGVPRSRITLNLTSKKSSEALKAILDLSKEPTRKIVNLIHEANSMLRPNIMDYIHTSSKKKPIIRGYYRPVKPSRQLLKSLESLSEYRPRTPEELALVRGAGPATIRALALIADLIHGIPSYDGDAVTHIEPYRYAYAVGGKDGVPYPFNARVARESIEILEYAIKSAKIGDTEKIRALRRMRTMLSWWRKHGF